MKFGTYLKENSIDEWRRAYINYRILKKCINRAAVELEELDAEEGEGLGVDEEGRILAGPSMESPTASGFAYTDGVRSTAQPRSNVDLDEVDRTLEEGTVLDEEIAAGEEPAPGVATSRRRSGTTPERSSDSAGPEMSTHSRSRLVTPPESLRRRQFVEPQRRKWRYSPDMPLRELVEVIPPASRRFFTQMDRELEKCTAFYGEREEEVEHRFNDLATQWRELTQHRKEYHAYKEREKEHSKSSAFLNPVVSRVPRALHLPGSHLVRRHVDSNNHDPNSLEEELEEPHEAALRGRPEEYIAAKSKLKLATFEFYRNLNLVKSYRVLNKTGFTKALKKFEKLTRVPAAKAYSAKLQAANFVKSEKLDDLIKRTEDAFTDVFEHGDRKKALTRLRMVGGTKTHHFTSLRSGLMLGSGVVLLIEGLVKAVDPATHVLIPQWKAQLQLFGAMFLPTLFLIGIAMNVVAWRWGRINYVLIFELDVRSMMDFRQIVELPAFLFFVFSLLFWASWNNFWPNHIAPTSYPLAYLVFALSVLFVPLPIAYPSARWWLICSLCRVFSAGLVRVQFRDFFIGDELASLYWPLCNFGFLVCTYRHHWVSDVNSICSMNKTWASPFIVSIPYLIRLGQSFRRYHDSDGVRIHLLNAGKYGMSVANFFVYYTWRIEGSPSNWLKALFVLFSSINSMYSLSWDLMIDWAMFRRGKHFLLRPELAYKDYVPLYYVAMIIDVLLRFSWVFYLAPHPDVQLKGFIVALVEVFRRSMWNVLRLEAEHVGNVDGFRVTRDVALPYAVTEATPLLDDDVEEMTSSKAQKIVNSMRTLKASLTQNFAPVSMALGKVTPQRRSSVWVGPTSKTSSRPVSRPATIRTKTADETSSTGGDINSEDGDSA